MDRARQICMIGWFSFALAAGFVSRPSDATAQFKPGSKQKPTSTLIVRAQNIQSDPVQTTAPATNDEVFDRFLLPAPAQLVGNAPQNCTNTISPDGSPYINVPSDSQLTPGSNAPTNDPNSIFSLQQQSQLPAPVSSLGAGQGSLTAMNQVPVFMGDFYGGVPTLVSNAPDVHNQGILIGGNGTVSTPGAAGVGVMKLAENSSPLPRDRVFISYNYFSDVNLVPGGMGVNRITPGVEKTFFDGNASIEVRVPMAVTLGSNTNLNSWGEPAYNTSQFQLGNVTSYLKALLYRDEYNAFSTGVGVGAPTANNSQVSELGIRTVAEIFNQAWHVMPFFGTVHTPNDRFFAQTMVQFDFAANGNSAYSLEVLAYSNLARYGSLRDPSYLFASLGTGYWIYRSDNRSARLQRISVISEFHFNSSLQSTNAVQGSLLNVGTYQSQTQTQNGVIGTNIMFDDDKSLMLGYVAPLGGGSDQAFAGEFRVLFNWYFGSQNRATRVQF